MPVLIHRLISACCLAAGVALSLPGGALAQTAQAEGPLNSYGLPGLIDMPRAGAMADGTLAFTYSAGAGTGRSTLAFQMAPRITGAFRYARFADFFNGRVDLLDRSFDLHMLLMRETQQRPALAIGLRDFGGTGLYGGEYVVASKHLGPALEVSAGLGWGRLASRGGMSSPLGWVSDRFTTRPAPREPGVSGTGQLDAGQWFRGPVAPFAGLRYQATDRLTLAAEYSSDAYLPERGAGMIGALDPINLGLSYKVGRGVELSGALLGGREVAVQVTARLNPGRTPPRQAAPTAGQSTHGLRYHGLSRDGAHATLWVENTGYANSADAYAAALTELAARAPESQSLTVAFSEAGLPMTALTLPRDQRAKVPEAADLSAAAAPPSFTPGLQAGLSPYLSWQLFDPDSPVRVQFGISASAEAQLAPGLSVAGELRLPLFGNTEDATRVSDSTLPHVRSDGLIYGGQDNLHMPRLYGQYLFRPGPDLFGRVSLGYLEPMFAGASAELLWAPAGSPLAFGAELNYARQRDYAMDFGLRDYGVVTGHLSAYFDFAGPYSGQIDIGRYLAGDWGATLSVDRVFASGARVGAFATFTDVSFDEFGEGAFDKGIRISLPTSLFSGKPSRQRINQTFRPVQRDGGARLNVPNRLYDLTRDHRHPTLARGWPTTF